MVRYFGALVKNISTICDIIFVLRNCSQGTVGRTRFQGSICVETREGSALNFD